MKVIHRDVDGNLITVLHWDEFWRITGVAADDVQPGAEFEVKNPSSIAAAAVRLREAIDREFPLK